MLAFDETTNGPEECPLAANAHCFPGTLQPMLAASVPPFDFNVGVCGGLVHVTR